MREIEVVEKYRIFISLSCRERNYRDSGARRTFWYSAVQVVTVTEKKVYYTNKILKYKNDARKAWETIREVLGLPGKHLGHLVFFDSDGDIIQGDLNIQIHIKMIRIQNSEATRKL